MPIDDALDNLPKKYKIVNAIEDDSVYAAFMVKNEKRVGKLGIEETVDSFYFGKCKRVDDKIIVKGRRTTMQYIEFELDNLYTKLPNISKDKLSTFAALSAVKKYGKVNEYTVQVTEDLSVDEFDDKDVLVILAEGYFVSDILCINDYMDNLPIEEIFKDAN
jgi:hypothetical protein